MNNIIQQSGKYWKKVQTLLLPTEKESKIHIMSNGDFIHYNNAMIRNDVQSQHLYFLSDSEIKKGDWHYYEGEVKQTTQATMIYLESSDDKGFKKIIASTDESLSPKQPSIRSDVQSLPKPSNEFLQDYCNANGKGFEEVLVEVHYSNGYFGNVTGLLKVAPDNTINAIKT